MSDTALHQDPHADAATGGRRSVFHALSRTFDAIRTPGETPDAGVATAEPQPAPAADSATASNPGPASSPVQAEPGVPAQASPQAGDPAPAMAAEAVSASPEPPPAVEPPSPPPAPLPPAPSVAAPRGIAVSAAAPPAPAASVPSDPPAARPGPGPAFFRDPVPMPSSTPFPSDRFAPERLRSSAVAPESRSVIGGACRIVGNIDSDGDVEIAGHLVGDVRARGLVLASNALVEGNVQAESAEIHGRLKGIVVAGAVHIAGTGDVVGEVHYLRLSMADGALIEGTCRRREATTGP